MHCVCHILFVKYTSETVASAENQGELEDCDENMKQAVDCYSDKYLQLVSKSFDNLSRDDEDTCKLFLNLYRIYLNRSLSIYFLLMMFNLPF